LLEGLARPGLVDLFGPALKRVGRASYLTEEYEGDASLACLCPADPPRLRMASPRSGKPKLRLDFSDGDVHPNAPVTDLRMYEADGVTPDERRIRDAADRLRRGTPAILSVGLTRAFSSSPNYPPAHWLQVNNIHLADDPIWGLC